jgi:hypothetical protein
MINSIEVKVKVMLKLKAERGVLVAFRELSNLIFK